MSQLDPDIRAILDTMIVERRLGSTSTKRIANLIAARPKSERWVERGAAVQYLLDREVNPDDPLTRSAVAALNSGVDAPIRSARPTQIISTRTRSHKGRQLDRLPSGLKVAYDGAVAEIRMGQLRLADGQRFSSPTPAARHVTGQRSVNGWAAWTVLDDGRSLADFYDGEGL